MDFPTNAIVFQVRHTTLVLKPTVSYFISGQQQTIINTPDSFVFDSLEPRSKRTSTHQSTGTGGKRAFPPA